MAGICIPECVTALTPFSTINVCNLTTSLRSGEIAKLVFFKCNSVVIDVTSDTEWGTLFSSGNAIKTLVGRGTISEKSSDGVIRLGCQDVATISKYPFTYESELVDATLATDASIYNDLNNAKLNLTVAFLTCDGWLIINPDYTTGTNIGLKLDALNISPVYSGEANSKTKYVINGALSEDAILKPIKLTSAVLALL